MYVARGKSRLLCSRIISLILLMGAFLCASDAVANSLDWLNQSIDRSRNHQIGLYESWHARLMVLAWGFLLPLGIIVARFFKIWPGQNWPAELDRREWWRAHLLLQGFGSMLAIAGVVLVFYWSDHTARTDSFVHRTFGWLAMMSLLIQVCGGLFRGTRGGPTYRTIDGSVRGDHYDMTRRRKTFEYIHKSVGYLALVFAAIAIVQGLWMINAPRWMWLGLAVWWALLFITAGLLQLKGCAVDTYQAIWGPDSKHPGNACKPIGFGIHRRKA